MKHIPFAMMILGGVILLVPRAGTDSGHDILTEAYKADRTAKVQILDQLGRMDADAETRSKSFAELDKKAFGETYEKWGKRVSSAIQSHTEATLAREID